MKYIKYYENIDNSKKELSDICFEYLAFLYDEGFSTQINKIYGLNSNDFEISIVHSDTNNFKKDRFKWINIKDDIIPFYEILKDKYTLLDYFGGKANYPSYIEIYTSNDEFYVCDYELEDLKFENILSINFIVSV